MKIIRFFLKWLLYKSNLLKGDVHKNDRVGGIFRAWGHVFSNHLDGDYVEFGVYRGDSVISSINSYLNFYSWLMGQYKSKEMWRREVAKKSPLNKAPIFHCLDTFEGMPQNSEGFISYEQGNFPSSFENVRKRIARANKKNITVKYYKGLFSNNVKELRNSLKKEILL